MALRSGFWEHRVNVRMGKTQGGKGSQLERLLDRYFWALTRAGRVDRRKRISEAKDTELIGSEGRAAQTEPNSPPVSIRRGLRLRYVEFYFQLSSSLRRNCVETRNVFGDEGEITLGTRRTTLLSYYTPPKLCLQRSFQSDLASLAVVLCGTITAST